MRPHCIPFPDEQHRPLPEATVETWPNIRYGEWGSFLLMSDCYNTADFVRNQASRKLGWGETMSDFRGVTDQTGVAVISNVPRTERVFTVKHSHYVAPDTITATGGKGREQSMKLVVGKTNRISVTMEPAAQSPIKHY
jgi:hypothetical protein